MGKNALTKLLEQAISDTAFNKPTALANIIADKRINLKEGEMTLAEQTVGVDSNVTKALAEIYSKELEVRNSL